MQESSSHSASGGFLQATRTIAHTGIWAGAFLKRHITSSWTGICPICNNLQPFGHEDTLGKTPRSAGRWTRFDGRQPLTQIVKEPALFIPDIETKVLLQVRDVDKKTGKPIRDCRYCRLVCDVLDLFFIDEYMSWITDTKNGMHLSVGLMIHQGSPLVINCSGSFVHDPNVMHPRADVEMFCVTGDELSTPGLPTMGLVAPRIMDTRDASCMRFARQCIAQCLGEHPECGRKSPAFVPTRLLVLGEDEKDIRLCDSPPPSAKWAALSHCWGGSQPLKLMSSSINDMKQSIDFSALPPTFKDAIQVCRSLSITWLWIDSLCIIQDSKLDWQQEAAQMGTIYQEAFLVIIGASSSKPEHPFLAPREEEWDTKTIHFDAPSGARVPIMARRRTLLAAPLDYGEFDPPFTETWATLKRVGPLYKRSWCFQESFLASRALHFAPGALIFECKTHRRSDDSDRAYSLAQPDPSMAIQDDTKWRMIIKSYTSRQLTYASDKLPAASGIASLTPQASTDEYLAGLWRKPLLIDLLWQAMPCNGRTGMTMTYPSDQQQAPSWSWASLNHGVLWNHFNQFEPLATVDEAVCAVDGANPYGAVSSGRIKLTGRIIPCVVRQDHQHHAYYIKPDGQTSAEQWFMGDGRLVPTTHNDLNPITPMLRRYSVSMGSMPGGTLTAGAFVFCTGRTGVTHYDHVGLVLTLSEDHLGCMERIGNITNLPRGWYEDAKPMTIVLV
ncbi:hypothetical protein PT974_01302 [Cladobotryum mycophilum]|uniref:Heterokaryon incompatibility domain-containing protein n=1 Tax=Cladobotryum mycophilum TaxID=491253 RepID=A0ABR0T387_9HYPO